MAWQAAAQQVAADDNLTVPIDAVDLEPMHGQIQADCGNLHAGRLPSFSAASIAGTKHLLFWTCQL
jgi:hypothetical protein